MSAGKLRLAVTAALFLGWVGWLAYLALVKPRTPVVSRSQMIATTHPVVARIERDADGRPTKAVVERALGPHAGNGPRVGETLTLTRLPDARLSTRRPFPEGDTLYLVPLARTGDGRFELAASPRSPGHDIPAAPLIYPWGPEVERQAAELVR